MSLTLEFNGLSSGQLAASPPILNCLLYQSGAQMGADTVLDGSKRCGHPNGVQHLNIVRKKRLVVHH
jgi:hypothetical protein